MQKRRRMPTDPSKLAKSIIDIATGQAPAEPTDPRTPAAISIAQTRARKGGNARAASLSRRRRSAIAKKAARSRWSK